MVFWEILCLYERTRESSLVLVPLGVMLLFKHVIILITYNYGWQNYIPHKLKSIQQLHPRSHNKSELTMTCHLYICIYHDETHNDTRPYCYIYRLYCKTKRARTLMGKIKGGVQGRRAHKSHDCLWNTTDCIFLVGRPVMIQYYCQSPSHLLNYDWGRNTFFFFLNNMTIQINISL